MQQTMHEIGIIIKSSHEIAIMRDAGRVVGNAPVLGPIPTRAVW